MRYIALLFLFFTNAALGQVDLVKVDKSERKLYLMDDGAVVKEYDVAFGANPKGHKQKEGNERTPEGTYALDYKRRIRHFIVPCT